MSLIVPSLPREACASWFISGLSNEVEFKHNEYAVKWLIFWDALTRNRTDGALVRVTTFVPDVNDIADADLLLESFVRSLNPKLAYYLPQEDATFVQANQKMVDGLDSRF